SACGYTSPASESASGRAAATTSGVRGTNIRRLLADPLGYRDLRENALHDVVGADALELRIRMQDDAVAENRSGEGLHVVGYGVAATLSGSVSPRARDQAKRAARGGAQIDRAMVARSRDDLDRVIDELRIHADLPQRFLHEDEVCRGE